MDNELSQALNDALGTLTPRYHKVMELYYREDLTLREIGQIMGVNESRVCQIHAAAIQKLRAHLTSTGIDGVKAFAAAA